MMVRMPERRSSAADLSLGLGVFGCCNAADWALADMRPLLINSSQLTLAAPKFQCHEENLRFIVLRLHHQAD